VDRTLPPCAKTAFHAMEPKPWLKNKHAASSSAPAAARALHTRLLALLAVCVLAACGAAVVACQHRHRGGQLRHSQLGTRDMPGLADEEAHTSLLSRGISSLRQQAGLLAGWGLTRRDRLEGVLNSELPGRPVRGANGSSGGSSSSGTGSKGSSRGTGSSGSRASSGRRGGSDSHGGCLQMHSMGGLVHLVVLAEDEECWVEARELLEGLAHPPSPASVLPASPDATAAAAQSAGSSREPV